MCQNTPMRCHAAISEQEETVRAVAEVVAAAREGVGQVDLAFVFLSCHHLPAVESLVERLWLELDPRALVGCSGGGVIGVNRELERQPGLAVLVAQVEDVRAHPFHIRGDDFGDLLLDHEALRERVGWREDTRALIGFGDPWTAPTASLLSSLETAAPLVPVVGGLASCGRRRDTNVLLHNDQVLRDGLVGLTLGGPLKVDTVVSQGCRPIGHPLVATRTRENLIEQLAGRPALDVLRDLVHDLPPADQELLEKGLLIGLAISEYRDHFGRGDFLVRDVIGVDQENKTIALAECIRTGQTVQFHVRDARTAEEDLALLLDGQRLHGPPSGGLLFSCNGRGQRLFDQPHRDISAVAGALPGTPLAGFFAAGELGPIDRRNFIHGHTASLALFREL